MAAANHDRNNRVIWQETVVADAGRLSDFRGRLRQVADELGITGEEPSKLVLAFDEAMQNIIRHGYRETGTGPVEIDVRVVDGVLTLRLRDYAEPADLAAIRPRDLDQLRPGGLGTFFIRTVMDEVTYSHADDGRGNVVIMRWRLGERGAPD